MSKVVLPGIDFGGMIKAKDCISTTPIDGR